MILTIKNPLIGAAAHLTLTQNRFDIVTHTMMLHALQNKARKIAHNFQKNADTYITSTVCIVTKQLVGELRANRRRTNINQAENATKSRLMKSSV